MTQKFYKPAFSGAMLMLAAGLTFAIINTLIQLATMQLGEKPASVAFWQYFIALLFGLPWVLARLRVALATSLPALHVLRVVFAAAGVQLWVFGLAIVPIWQAVALIMTSPFFVTIGAGLVLGERITVQRWIAVILGFVGGMIILAPWSDEFTSSALLPVGAALLWALSSLTTKFLARTDGPDTLTLYLLLLLTPINAALAVPSGFAIVGIGAWGLVIAAGALTAAAQYALARAYQVADAAYLQPFDHVKLLFNIGLGWAMFGFLPEGSMWWGTALIVVSSTYLLKSESTKRRRYNPGQTPNQTGETA